VIKKSILYVLNTRRWKLWYITK